MGAGFAPCYIRSTAKRERWEGTWLEDKNVEGVESCGPAKSVEWSGVGVRLTRDHGSGVVAVLEYRGRRRISYRSIVS